MTISCHKMHYIIYKTMFMRRFLFSLHNMVIIVDFFLIGEKLLYFSYFFTLYTFGISSWIKKIGRIYKFNWRSLIVKD